MGLVGKSGQILWDCLSQYGIKRDYLFVENTVKCRPPKNKLPNIKYAQKCGKLWLEPELDLFKPTVVLSLGGPAADFFRRGEKVSELAGKIYWNARFSCWVTYCYHPASLIYDPSNRSGFEAAIKKFVGLIKKIF